MWPESVAHLAAGVLLNGLVPQPFAEKLLHIANLWQWAV
jgi:hypothetical protein